jgi:hypothetical protein
MNNSELTIPSFFPILPSRVEHGSAGSTFEKVRKTFLCVCLSYHICQPSHPIVSFDISITSCAGAPSAGLTAYIAVTFYAVAWQAAHESLDRLRVLLRMRAEVRHVLRCVEVAVRHSGPQGATAFDEVAHVTIAYQTIAR